MKDTPWFKHDANARTDPKFKALTAVYGDAGAGRFWKLIEMLREASDYRLERKQYIFDAFADEMRPSPGEEKCTTEMAEKFIDDCIDRFGLLRADNRFFWSDRLLRNMEEKDLKSQKARSAVLTRWNKYDRNTTVIPNREEESREEEVEEKELKQPSSPADYTEEFNSFWTVYPRKIGKVAAFKVWKTRLKEKVSPDDLIKAATNYAAECRKKGTEERYIKHPETFIGPDKHYNDYMEVRAVETPAAGVDDQPMISDEQRRKTYAEMQARRDRKAAALAALAALEVNEKQPATEETLTEEPDNTDDC